MIAAYECYQKERTDNRISNSPCAGKSGRETGTESRYCFQLCRGNQFPFCQSTETAGRIGNRKDGTALVTGAIPPNLKLLPSNRKYLILLVFYAKCFHRGE